MITRYPRVDMKRSLVLIFVPLFLMVPSVLAVANATSNTITIPEDISNAISNQITPVLLAPMATSGNNVYIVWPSNATGHLEISFRASSDNGQTFADKVNLSNTPNMDSTDPQIAASGNYVHISWWEDYGNGTRIPFFRTSNDDGHTFGLALSLSDNGPIPMQDDSNTSSTVPID
jgi:hypothetical protein